MTSRNHCRYKVSEGYICIALSTSTSEFIYVDVLSVLPYKHIKHEKMEFCVWNYNANVTMLNVFDEWNLWQASYLWFTEMTIVKK